jgi:hypothetical protein
MRMIPQHECINYSDRGASIITSCYFLGGVVRSFYIVSYA